MQNKLHHSSLKVFLRNSMIALLVAFLSGCATSVQTRVAVFHELESSLTGVTYAFAPSKEQDASLEFRSYAKLVKAEFSKRGVVETPLDQAKYAVFIFYNIDDGKQVVSSYPIFGQTGTSSSYTTGAVTSYGNTASYNSTTYNNPTYGVVGSGSSTGTVFTRYLDINIIDIEKSKASNDKVQKVYEGKAVSSGSSGQLASVMSAMIRSVFEDFPGKNGSTRTSVQSAEK